MKANEFVNESIKLRIDPKLKIEIDREINRQVTSFRKNLIPLGFFEIYDIMNAVATANGVDQVNVVHPQHNHNAAAPYTEIERKMLQAAYTSIGQPWDDSILDLSNDPDQQQSDGEQSPVIGFKGYPR